MKKVLFILSVVFCTYAKAQIISTFAGTGPTGFFGDGGAATAAVLYNPAGVTINAAGNIHIADSQNHRVRMINASGTISTVVGNGTVGYSGDGGQATAAQLNVIGWIYFDATGNMYLADPSNNCIRKVNTAGIISTVAGTGTGGYAGDGGQATVAKLTNPTSVVVDASGNMYIADYNNNRVRKVNTAGVISTFAGTGIAGYAGDGGQATDAKLYTPQGLCLDASGNLYISERNNNTIRKVNAAGIISTVAGNNTQGYSGDGGQATAAALWDPNGICFDAGGSLYIADISNNRIRRVSVSGTISTVAGNGYGSPSSGGDAGDGGPATAAQLYYPNGVNFDASGNLYIADLYNNRIRQVTCAPVLSINVLNGVCPGSVTTLTASGADTYTWSSNAGSVQTATTNVSPVGATTYTVAGTSVFGCTSTQTISVQVNSLPVVNISGPSSVCIGSHAILNGMGANTYTWSSNAGGSNTNAVNINPTVNTTYTVTGTDGNGCRNFDTLTVIVNMLPTITANSATICAGNPASLNANGANTYTWSNGQTGASISTSPAITTNYTVTGTDVNSCKNIDVVTVDVNPSPTITANSTTVCADSATTLSANGALSYIWSTGQAGASISASPTATTFYTVTGTGANNCTSTQTLTVTVNNCTMGISILQTVDMGLTIYPNPSTGYFVVECSSNMDLILQVYDINGKLVLLQFTNGKTTIDASTLPNGIYNLSVISQKGVSNKCLLIAK